jgi:hypothetical protein
VPKAPGVWLRTPFGEHHSIDGLEPTQDSWLSSGGCDQGRQDLISPWLRSSALSNESTVAPLESQLPEVRRLTPTLAGDSAYQGSFGDFIFGMVSGSLLLDANLAPG